MSSSSMEVYSNSVIGEIPPDVSLGLTKSKEYSDEAFDASEGIYIEVHSRELLEAYEKFFIASLHLEVMNVDVLYVMLVLASHLFRPETGFETDDCLLLGWADIPNLSSMKPVLESFIAFTENESAQFQVQSHLKSSCFVAAYLFRLIAKQMPNPVDSWKRIKERFQGFYWDSLSGSLSEPVSEGCLRKLKGWIVGNPLIVRTWVKIISYNEGVLDEMTPAAGMLRFLAVIPLGYSGMHVMKLTIDILMKTNYETSWFLKELLCPVTVPALMEIAKIIREHHQTIRRGKYKYARLIGPQYFQQLQTKQCPELVYILVVLYNLEVSQGQLEGGDPCQIFGIQDIPESTRDMLSNFADNIYYNGFVSHSYMYSNAAREVFMDIWRERKGSEPPLVI